MSGSSFLDSSKRILLRFSNKMTRLIVEIEKIKGNCVVFKGNERIVIEGRSICPMFEVLSPYMCDNMKKLCTSGSKRFLAMRWTPLSRQKII